MVPPEIGRNPPIGGRSWDLGLCTFDRSPGENEGGTDRHGEEALVRNLVVGVDGAPSSLRALDWAVSAVGPGGHLHAVSAVSPPTELAVVPGPSDDVTYLQLLQRELETVWLDGVRDRTATLSGLATNGDASDALAAEAIAYRADAIVVGAHVPHRGVPKTIGTTTRHLLKSLPCPLIVVPDGFSGELDDDGHVMVGIGHGEATESAVCWAAHVADERQLAVGLVRATGEAPVFEVDGLLSLLAFYIDPGTHAEWTRQDLADFAERVQTMTDHELSIDTSAPPGLPAVRLVDASSTASLLVIGHHRSTITGHSHATQRLRHALTHALCPVVVVPADGDPEH